MAKAKIALAALSMTGVASTGTWMYVTSSSNYITLAENSSSTYNGKFGGDFKHHMVDAQSTYNTGWWNEVFQKKWIPDNSKSDNSIDTNFKDISSGEKLKEKCEESYQKETKKETKKEIHATDKASYAKSVWRYCSLEGEKPSTIKEASNKTEEGGGSSDSSKIGKSNEDYLVSTVDTKNKKFWEIQEKAFFKTTVNGEEKEGLGASATDPSSKFKTLYEKSSRGPKDTLQETCKEVYKEENTSETSKKDALKFCALGAKEEEKKD